MMNPLLEYKRIKQAVLRKNNFSARKETVKEEQNGENEWERKQESKNMKSEMIAINRNKMNRLLSNLNNETKYLSKHQTKVEKNWEQSEEQEELEEEVGSKFLGEENMKIKELMKYEYCCICEIAKPCYCDENGEYEEKENSWSMMKTRKANIHSNFIDISKLMKNIKDSKNKQEEFVNKNEKEPLKKDHLNKKEIKKKSMNKTVGYYENFYRGIIQIIKQKLENTNKETKENVLTATDKRSDNKKNVNPDANKEIEERLSALRDMELKHLQLLSELLEEHGDVKKKILQE